MTTTVVDRTEPETGLEFDAGASLYSTPPGPARDAAAHVAERFDRLRALQPNWDGERAAAIDHAALRVASELARNLMRDGLPQPEIFPAPDGGIQLEWHAGPVEVEIEIEPGQRSVLFVCDDERYAQRFDGELPEDELLLRLALARLASHT